MQQVYIYSLIIGKTNHWIHLNIKIYFNLEIEHFYEIPKCFNFLFHMVSLFLLFISRWIFLPSPLVQKFSFKIFNFSNIIIIVIN